MPYRSVVAVLQEENARFRAALEFLADPDGSVHRDTAVVARAALLDLPFNDPEAVERAWAVRKDAGWQTMGLDR